MAKPVSLRAMACSNFSASGVRTIASFYEPSATTFRDSSDPPVLVSAPKTRARRAHTLGPVRDAHALAADLHTRGLRVTPQRQLIYSLLAENRSHPTVKAVHAAVCDAMPTVSLRTVYQALHELEAMGDIRLVQVGDGPLRVDTEPEHQAHLRCTECGRVHDVDVDLSGLVLTKEQRRGFALEGAEVIFSGRCPTCAGESAG